MANSSSTSTPATQVQGGPQQSTQNPGPSNPQHTHQDKVDSVSKVKTMMTSFSEAVHVALKVAAQALYEKHDFHNNGLRIDTEKQNVFDKSLEELLCLCDQMEVNLITALSSLQHTQLAGQYIKMNVNPLQYETSSQGLQEDNLSYPQYLVTVRLQISYAKDIHDMLVAATQNLTSD